MTNNNVPPGPPPESDVPATDPRVLNFFWSRPVRLGPELQLEKFTDAAGRERYRLTSAAKP